MNQPSPYSDPYKLISRNICLIVSLVCLVIFVVDIAVITTPPDIFSLDWRVNFYQQLSDRSLLFLIGAALLLYSIFRERELTQKLSRLCLVIGVIYVMSSILVIRDSVTLREQTFRNLDLQRRELQATIQETQVSGELPPEISSSEVQQASQSIADTADAVRRSAGRDIVKVSVSSVGNLIAVGVGFIGLSRVGLTRFTRY